MKKIILLAFILPLIASCESNSDDNLINIDPIRAKKLMEVTKNGAAYYKFKYNDNGNISEIYNYFNGLINATTKIEYSNNLQIKYSQYNSNNSLSSYQVFTYQGNLITNRKIYFVNNGVETLNSSAEYINDFSKKNNNIISIKYMNGSGTITSKRQIVYTDDNGSSVAEVFDSNNVKTNIITINKDGAKSWNKVLDPFIYQNETNTISSNDKNVLNNSTSGYSVKYVYDKENYPVSSEYKYTNGTTENYTYTWN